MPRCVCHPSGIALRHICYPALKRWAKLFRASGAGVGVGEVLCSGAGIRVGESFFLRRWMGMGRLLGGIHGDDALDGTAADGTE